MNDYGFSAADLFDDDPLMEAIRDSLDDARRRALAEQRAEAEAKQGYYLRDEHTGEKIYMKAQPVERCQAIHTGHADKWCDVCMIRNEDESADVEAIVCMWKSEFGNPFDTDSWAHYCAACAREAGLPV